MAPKSWIIRDKLARQFVPQNEVARQALRYFVRDQEQSMESRLAAQDLLSKRYPTATRRHSVVPRCIVTGRAQVSKILMNIDIEKGIITEYRLSRIQFREYALDGKLPGVSKASW